MKIIIEDKNKIECFAHKDGVWCKVDAETYEEAEKVIAKFASYYESRKPKYVGMKSWCSVNVVLIEDMELKIHRCDIAKCSFNPVTSEYIYYVRLPSKEIRSFKESEIVSTVDREGLHLLANRKLEELAKFIALKTDKLRVAMTRHGYNGNCNFVFINNEHNNSKMKSELSIEVSEDGKILNVNDMKDYNDVVKTEVYNNEG